ncbi:hypothetical protein DOY81_006919 [Sarcophaga bullata]|nr:hypothetical protein DOY81_006919 [Sarcophaga bullata]
MGTFAVGGGAPPENALDALLDELKTFSKPLIQNNEIRPDDSTSDDSTAMVQSTVTTQISQARLYNQSEAGTPPLLMASNCVSELQQQFNNISINNQNNTTPITVPMITATNVSSLRRLHSMPTQCESDIVPIPIMRNIAKPPVPERNAELIMKVGGKRIPPPPPPRTSSRSPLASPTSPNVPQPMPTLNEMESKDSTHNVGVDSSGENSSGNESGNDNVQRQVALEMRHQELLKKQKMLQEQYQRLQQMSKMPSVDMSSGTTTSLDPNSQSLKKMGSESNLQQKLNLTINSNDSSLNTNVSSASSTSSNELANNRNVNDKLTNNKINNGAGGGPTTNSTTTKQVYETEIL